MGILLYFMVTALMPFRAENVDKLSKSIIDGNYSIPSYLSNECQELIRELSFHLLKLNSMFNHKHSV
jgi:serine/threonine-protein kinase NIM1